MHRDTEITSAPLPTKILSAAAAGSIELFKKHHGDVDTILGHAGIRHDDLNSPLNELNLGQYCCMFEEAARVTGNDNIGLEFGQKFMPKQLGMLGFAAISSPTLAAALRTLEAYFPAHQGQTSFTLLQDCGILWLSYRIFDKRINKRRQDAELSLGMFCNIFKEALGPNWVPLEVRFEHARPDGGGEHAQRFGAPVQFGRRTNAIAFRRSDLDARMPGHDSYLFSVVKPFLESRCAPPNDPQQFAMMIKNEIKLHLGESLSPLPEIAKLMGLSDHGLQKLLKVNAISFSDILRAARQELALHYMSNSDMSLTEIAYNLGYSELSAFSRAFRAWTGISPQRFRRSSR